MCGETGPVLSGLITLTMRSLSSVYSCHQSLGQGILLNVQTYFRSELWYPGFLYKRVLMRGLALYSDDPGDVWSCLRPGDTRMTRGLFGWLMSCCGLNGSCLAARNLERWMRDGEEREKDARGLEDAAREGQRQVRMLVCCDDFVTIDHNTWQYVTRRHTRHSSWPGHVLSRRLLLSRPPNIPTIFLNTPDISYLWARWINILPPRPQGETRKQSLANIQKCSVWAFGCIGIVFIVISRSSWFSKLCLNSRSWL